MIASRRTRSSVAIAAGSISAALALFGCGSSAATTDTGDTGSTISSGDSEVSSPISEAPDETPDEVEEPAVTEGP
jgi:hypothetical protein